MNSIDTFIEYFKDSMGCSMCRSSDEEELSNAFFRDFIEYTPLVLVDLRNFHGGIHYNQFYSRLSDLKYLCVFDEEMNRYWFAMRAYSGALAKLESADNIDQVKSIYSYYIEKYGDRRALRGEHWFEQKRWAFLDALSNVDSMSDLIVFIENQQKELCKQLDDFDVSLQSFIHQLKKSLISGKDL